MNRGQRLFINPISTQYVETAFCLIDGAINDFDKYARRRQKNTPKEVNWKSTIERDDAKAAAQKINEFNHKNFTRVLAISRRVFRVFVPFGNGFADEE